MGFMVWPLTSHWKILSREGWCDGDSWLSTLTITGMNYNSEMEGILMMQILRQEDNTALIHILSQKTHLKVEARLAPALSAHPLLHWHWSLVLWDSSIDRRSAQTPGSWN